MELSISLVIRALVILLFSSSLAQAASSGGGFGVYLGAGIPFLSQVGVTYQFSSHFGMSAGYNILDVEVDSASVKLTMPEILVTYHPFAGSFFLGAGIGKENLKVTATDSSSGNTASAEVDATTTILKTGWMWGAANGGFWFGIDYSYIMPSGAESTIDAGGAPTNSDAYQDAVDAAEQFGESKYGNITFARFGWIF